MITEIQRTLTGVYSYANSSILFDSNPYLLANSELILYFTNNNAKYAATVFNATGNNVVTSFSNAQYANNRVTVKTNYYGSGLTGAQEPFTFKFASPPNAIIQACSDGGTSNLSLEVSTDQNHWITYGNLIVTVANANSAFVNVTAPWPYGRLNIVDIGSGKQIFVNKAT